MNESFLHIFGRSYRLEINLKRRLTFPAAIILAGR